MQKSQMQMPIAPFDEVFAKLNNITGDFLSLDGRARRGEYWVTAICFALPVMVVSWLANLIAFSIGSAVFYIIVSILLGLLGLVTFPVSVRRWHDLGFSSWIAVAVIFACCIPRLGGLVGLAAFVFFCLPGKPETNVYGDSPLVPSASATLGRKEPVTILWGAGVAATLVKAIVNAINVAGTINALNDTSGAVQGLRF